MKDTVKQNNLLAFSGLAYIWGRLILRGLNFGRNLGSVKRIAYDRKTIASGKMFVIFLA